MRRAAAPLAGLSLLALGSPLASAQDAAPVTSQLPIRRGAPFPAAEFTVELGPERPGQAWRRYQRPVGPPAPAQGLAARPELSGPTGDRVELVVSAPPAAGGALGGLGGATIPALGGAAYRPDRLRVLAGPGGDARVTIQLTELVDGKLERRVYDLRANSLLAFGGVALGGVGGKDTDQDGRPDQLGASFTGFYAEGEVRLDIEGNREGSLLLRAEQVYLDVLGQQVFLHDPAEEPGVELRVAPLGSGPGGRLAGLTPVLRARWLRVYGTQRFVADEAAITNCDHGDPHYAFLARSLEVRQVGVQPAGSVALVDGLLGTAAPARRGGSDAAGRGLSVGRNQQEVELEAVRLEVLGQELPLLPGFTWNTAWPLPVVRVGSSNQLGTFAQARVVYGLGKFGAGPGGLDLRTLLSVEHYSKRGTGGDVGLSWDHIRPNGGGRGEGFFQAFGIQDRGDTDRVGTPIRNEGRFWLRGLVREGLPGPKGQLDAEVSRFSDPGVLLEYFRQVAQTEKEQETYVHLRWRYDAHAFRVLTRYRLNSFQDQVERLPEARWDGIHLDLLQDEDWGGLYLDTSVRAGYLRQRFSDAGGLTNYEAGRADARFELSYANSLGPLQFRAWGAARETVYTERSGDEASLDRFLGEAGWNLSTTFWKRFATPVGYLRHEVLPEVGTRHRFRVTRDPAELLLFDPDVEPLQPTDFVFLRLRTRLLTDSLGQRRKLLDLAVETRYFPRDRGADVARSWGSLFWDLRLDLISWLSGRIRAEQDLNAGDLLTLDLAATARPVEDLQITGAFRESTTGNTRAISWGFNARLTRGWALAFEQQYELEADEFTFHRARIVRFFHRFALEGTGSFDPQQDDVSFSVSLRLSSLFGDDTDSDDPFREDRYRDLYR